VAGVYDNRFFSGSVLVDYVLTTNTFELAYGVLVAPTFAYLQATPGAGETLRAEVASTLAGSYPDIRVQDIAAFQAEQDRWVDLITNVLLALLAFCLLIAVLGIVNTLLLAVYERTRELGLLRTVGMSVRQMRRMVRGEAIVISIFGCALGVALGLVWSLAFAGSLETEGVTRVSIPLVRLAVLVVLAASAGVLASIVPARRAARLDVLEAVAEE
jgi:putative ABC transport system permease protein